MCRVWGPDDSQWGVLQMSELRGNKRVFLNRIAGYDTSARVVARHRLDVREGSQGTSTLQYTPSNFPLQEVFPLLSHRILPGHPLHGRGVQG